ncbi:DUF4190 domain-containing protein [Streptomyces sp. 71268]|uniref:DUF4190 domain-containing protein n=1 Tax=Streptomyces sp. 71268 TaxID=3002640 RepID=UPI0023F8AA4A|nr:DUF4190 domain-containing protein [Streptomyces sp. 71268]WEV26960.1 DUF4190 domain-containing protein [Streptomyces sp. 71268]
MTTPPGPNPYQGGPNPYQTNPQTTPTPPGQPGQPPTGWPGHPPYYVVPQRTNGLAVASMVLGILWLYWIGSILALIFGYVARNQIRERGEGGGGMATAGLVLGWVGVGTLTAVMFFALFLNARY